MVENFGEDLGSILDKFYPLDNDEIFLNFVDRLIAKSKRIFGHDAYNYDGVTEDDIKSKEKKISVLCTRCYNRWNTNMNNHISNRRGCPACYGFYSRITGTKANIIVKEKYGNKFKYEGMVPKSRQLATQNHDYSVKLTGKITITCNKCGLKRSLKLKTFLLGETECLGC